MVKKKKGRVSKLAKHLKPQAKRAFSIGGTGASLTKRTKIDHEMGFDYRKRLRVPPVRGVKQLSEEQFKELLRDGKTKRPIWRMIDDVPMTKEEFKAKLADGSFLTRKGRRTITERRIATLEYFGGVEGRWWIQQQLKLLYGFDKQEEVQTQKMYKKWFNEYAPQVVAAVQALKKDGHKKEAKELQEYFELLIEQNKPRRIALVGLRYKVRILTLTGDTMALRQLYEELEPLKKALEPS